MKSNGENIRRTAFGYGASRATKYDYKRSEKAHQKQLETPQTPSSPSTSQASSKHPSPLLDLVTGAKSRTRENKAKAEAKKQAVMKAIVDDSLKFFFNRESLESSKFSIVETVSKSNPTSFCRKFNLQIPQSSLENQSIDLGSLITVSDTTNDGFIYSLVTKETDAHKPYLSLQSCLQNLKNHC